MKIQIIGSGGREHALAWKLSRSQHVSEIICAPGNAGMLEIGNCFPVPADDIRGQVQLAKKNKVDFVVVGPEIPLSLGIVEALADENIPVFGPDSVAAQLESSKAFMKKFCRENDIPTADFDICSDPESAYQAISKRGGVCVVKADGLAAGKGVIVCRDVESAKQAVQHLQVEKKLGEAGGTVIVEDRLDGEEASVMAVSDGHDIILMPASQDHKAVGEGDTGPNTGGMGAYSPAPVIDDAMELRVVEDILKPAVRAMENSGHPFKGLLYAGIMIVDRTPYLLEFNVRFGDPETQPVLMRLNSDLFEILYASYQGTIREVQPQWSEKAAVCVVLVSRGYPGSYEKGAVIHGLDISVPGVQVFHAGTARNTEGIVTSGGRVLGVTALGDDVSQAKNLAYQAVRNISFDNMYFRRDIAWRALRR